MTKGQKKGLDARLLAYSAAAGAAMAVEPAAHAGITHYQGPWSSSGLNTTLISFNLAGEVMTDGTNVADEQFHITNEAQTSTIPSLPPGSPVQVRERDMWLFPGPGFIRSNTSMTTKKTIGGGTTVNTNRTYFPVTVGAAVGPFAQGDLIGPGGQVPGPVSHTVVTTFLSATKTVPGVRLRGHTTANTAFGPGVDLFRSEGPWANQGPVVLGATPKGKPVTDNVPLDTRGYLGLQFDGAEDETFYGWADITLEGDGQSLTLWAYAYDDTGAPIQTGAVPLPGSLGFLVAGAAGLALFRRRRKPA